MMPENIPPDDEELPSDDDGNPFSRRSLRSQQLIEAVMAGEGFIVTDLETGEVVDIIPPRVTPETKANSAGSN